jgi:chromosomal replication initiator protein
LEETARYFNIPLHVLQSPARTKEIAAARFIAFQLLYSTIKLSKARIGKIFNRDHATVISGLRKFNNYYSTEEDFKNDYDTLLTRLNFHHD